MPMPIEQKGDYVLVEDGDELGCDRCCFHISHAKCKQPNDFNCREHGLNYHWELRKEYHPMFEEIDEFTSRMKVYGGWIIRTIITAYKGGVSSHQMFLEDTSHQWKLEEKKE